MQTDTIKHLKTTPKHRLTMDEFTLQAFIGCHEQEREHAQEVRLKVIINDPSLDQAAASDQLNDTFCYAKVLEDLREHCLSRHFNLIEHMAASCYHFLKQQIGPRSEIHVRLHKVEPPVAGLVGGVIFEYGDFL